MVIKFCNLKITPSPVSFMEDYSKIKVTIFFKILFAIISLAMELPASLVRAFMFSGIYDTYRVAACCDVHIHSYEFVIIHLYWTKQHLECCLSFFRKMTRFITNNICFWFKFTVNISNSREIDAVHEEYKQKLRDQEAFHRKQIQRQQLYVEDLKQQILRGQIKAERELENDQALINQQIQESGYLPLPLLQFPSITAYFHPLSIFCPSGTFF